MAIQPPASDAWTVSEVAEDFLAQVEDVQAAGWTSQEAIETLSIQGVDPQTAAFLWEQVEQAALHAGRPGPDSLDVSIKSSLLDVTAIARYIRVPGDPLSIDNHRIEVLSAALRDAGLRESTANQFVAEVASHERLILTVYRERMRRLGKQGMAAGFAFTAFFTWSALVSGGTAYWHLTTAFATLMLGCYSFVLYRNGRPPKLG